MFGLSCGVFWASASVVTLPPAWRTFEFCQYAEIGRNLALEGAFDTRLAEPMALAVIDRDQVGRSSRARWPVVSRYPLPCFVVAGLMKAFGTGEVVAAWSNGLAVSLLAAMTYAVALRWYGGRWAAAIALLFLANPSFYGEFILLGTPDVWLAATFFAELLVWSDLGPPTSERPRLGRASVLGLLGGLAFLSRFDAVLFLVPQGAALCVRRRWREALIAALAFSVVAAPVFVYNWRNFGRPLVSAYSTWNLLDGIGAYRVEPWLYYRVPAVVPELVAHRDGVARKWATNLLREVPLRIWSVWRLDVLLPLALLGPAFVGPSAERRRFARWSVGLFALRLVAFSALRLELEDRVSPHHGRYFFWFAAPALLLAVGTLRSWSARHPLLRFLAVAAVVAQLAVFGAAWRELVLRHPRDTNLGRDPIRKMLTEAVTDGRVIASNQPQITAWCSGLRSISLPADPAELDRLNRSSPTPADYLLIDSNFNAIQLDERWVGLVLRDPQRASPWEAAILREYQYVLPPRRTRPRHYVLLRRRVVPPSRFEFRANLAAGE